MTTRYSQLRHTIVMLAAAPQDQVDHLDKMLAPLTGGGSAEAYGNVELIETFADYFNAREHMLEYGELTQLEVDAVLPLDAVIDEICANQNYELWEREALFSDSRWQQLRRVASDALAHLLDEDRESDYTRSLHRNGS